MRFLTAPQRFVWGMAMWAVFLFLSPFLLVFVLVFGVRFMSRDEIDLVKVLLVVLGPLALTFWWITIRHVSSRNRAKRLIASRSQSGEEYSDADLRFLERAGKPRHIRNFVVLLTSLTGCTQFWNLSDQRYPSSKFAMRERDVWLSAASKSFAMNSIAS